MADRTFLSWPFFEEKHRALAAELEAWAAEALARVDHSDTDAACRALVAALGAGGWTQHSGAVAGEKLDVRTLCLIRETLARHDGLADFAFAMQGLGTGAISLFGTEAQQAEWLPLTRAGKAISAFALTEPQSGSDVANSSMTATRDGDDYVLNGEKTWISNGSIADVYTLFARTGEAPGAKGLSAFAVPAGLPGFEVTERLETIAPHPLATLRFTDCRIPAAAMLGQPGQGFKIAMSVLDVFRSTVAAAALGFARRALDEALARVTERHVQGAPLFDLQMVQGHIATARYTLSLHDALPISVLRGWPARRPWPSCFPPIRRKASSTRRCSCMAATGCGAARRWRSYTAISGRCGSMKAPPMCSGW